MRCLVSESCLARTQIGVSYLSRDVHRCTRRQSSNCQYGWWRVTGDRSVYASHYVPLSVRHFVPLSVCSTCLSGCLSRSVALLLFTDDSSSVFLTMCLLVFVPQCCSLQYGCLSVRFSTGASAGGLWCRRLSTADIRQLQLQ